MIAIMWMRLMRVMMCAAVLLAATIAKADNFDFSEGHERVRNRDFSGARAAYAKAMTNGSPAVRALAQLAIARTFVFEGQPERAKAEYGKLPSEAPQHLHVEARERIKELDRKQRGLPARDPLASRAQMKPRPKAAIVLHVSPTGADANSGTSEKPFATLERARDEIRARRKSTGAIASEVVVRGGSYRVSETLKLDAEDSNIVFRAGDGERPVFRGGVKLTGFEILKEGETFSRLPEIARGKVVRLDLKRVGITNVIPLKLGGFASGFGFKTHPAHELFFNGKAMQLARGPNEGFLHIKDVVVKDGTKGYDRSGSKVGEFVYEGELPAGWKSEPDLLLYGYWFWDWADSYERVKSIDTEKHVITVAEPFHTYGYSVGAPFYAINALSELDRPGEWYLDRQNGELLFYPPADLGSATVELSSFPQAMVELKKANDVRFEGITWELGSADAIRAVDCNNALFAGCTVRFFAGNGVEISGGTNNGILSCDVFSMGRGGTVISGGDRKTLAPGGNFIENSEIYDLSRIDHTYTPAVLLSGVGNRLAHNRFHDVLSSAMRVDGNDHVIEFNEIFNAVTESDDQGGADLFGDPTFRGNVFRFNHWHHIGNWEGKGEQPKCGQAGIRLDDAISGTLVYGNIFERCSAGKVGFGGVQIHGGKDNIIDNNLFIADAAAISFTPWADARWKEFVAHALDFGERTRGLYIEHYPQLAHLAENANENHVWRNRVSQGGEFLRRAPKNVDAIDNSALECCEHLDEVPGFNFIPADEIGLYLDAFRKQVTGRRN